MIYGVRMILMAKKKKWRVQAPPLSPLDKGIYYCLIACSFAIAFFLFPIIVRAYRQWVFEDPHILAQNNLATIILGFLGLFLGCGLMIVLDWLKHKKYPIFGNSKVCYGPPLWKPVYPLTQKQFWENLRPHKERLRIGVLCVVMLVILVASITSLALPPRECLHDDGSVWVYNYHNENTAKYYPSDVAEIEIYTRTYDNRKGRDYWGFEIEFRMYDGEDFFFSDRDFQTLINNLDGSVVGMLQIKSCFDPRMINITGRNNLAYVIRDMDLNAQETELLYLLFDCGST